MFAFEADKVLLSHFFLKPNQMQFLDRKRAV